MLLLDQSVTLARDERDLDKVWHIHMLSGPASEVPCVDTHESIFFFSTTSTKFTVCSVIYVKVFDFVIVAEASTSCKTLLRQFTYRLDKISGQKTG